MKAFKKLLALFLAGSLMLAAAGCSSAPKNVAKLANFDPPAAGDDIAVITVKDFGVIKVRFFSEYAPKGVENFVTHAKEGYYDELPFHRVVQDFMIQGGDPKGNGTGGESIWGEPFENEISDELRNFRGAVSYANSGVDTNGSQFFIVSASNAQLTDDYFDYLKKQYKKELPQNVKDKYKEVGGAPYLDGDYTVFGQVIEGMDVVDAIQNVEVTANSSGENSKPVDQVLVESITIEPYAG